MEASVRAYAFRTALRETSKKEDGADDHPSYVSGITPGITGINCCIVASSTLATRREEHLVQTIQDRRHPLLHARCVQLPARVRGQR